MNNSVNSRNTVTYLEQQLNGSYLHQGEYVSQQWGGQSQAAHIYIYNVLHMRDVGICTVLV